MEPIAPSVRIPLTNDIVFRYVFGEEAGLPLLEAMLNAFFSASGTPRVSGLRLLDGKLGPAFNDDKAARLDILATDASGRQIDIEIQTYRQDFYFERMLFYWSRLYGRQLGRGRNYTKLRPVIIVNILDLRLFAAGPWYRVDRLRFSDHLQIHYIELPKCPAAGPGAEEASRGGAADAGGTGGAGGGHPLHSAVLWGK